MGILTSVHDDDGILDHTETNVSVGREYSVSHRPVTLSPHAPVSRDAGRRLAVQLAPDADRVLKVTASLCPDCSAEGRYDEMVVPMVVYEQNGKILLAKECEEQGVIRDVYWRDVALYYRAQAWADKSNYPRSYHHVPEGPIACPVDWGLCPLHKSHTGLGNITVKNRCDLSCWYCFFYAREDDPLYEPTKAQIRAMARAEVIEGAPE